MPNEFPENNPQDIWQNQPTEPFKMSANEIRRKAHEHQRKNRSIALFGITIGLFIFIDFAWTAARVHETIPRIGWGLMSLWGIYFAYQVYQRILPARLGPEATVSTSLEFYKSELEKRLEWDRYIWRRSGLPVCFLGLAMVLVPILIQSLNSPRILPYAIPIFILLVIWAIAFVHLRKRQQQELQQDTEELVGLEVSDLDTTHRKEDP